MADPIQIGDTVSVSDLGMTRRGWLRSLALGGTGIAGLKSAIKRAAGASVEGVPLVLTRDKRGNPDRVRFVSQERYETLERYRNLDIETYFERYPNLNGITVTTPRDRIQPYDAESGLDLKFYFDKTPRADTHRSLPNRVGPMTIHTQKRPVRRRQDCRDEVRTEPVGGGSQVYVRNADDNTIAEGTLGVVCVDNYGREVVTTAGHVAEKSFGGDDRMWQAGQLVGERVAYDAGCDIASYEAQFVRHQPGNVVESGISDINGTWDFAGLADETSGWWSQGPAVEFAGMINCYGETTVEETERNDSVVYQVTMADNVTDTGDSGGPYVDEDGTLAALHSGTQGMWVLGNSYGAAGTESLQAISARLE